MTADGFKQYQGIEAINFSVLKHMAKSALHFNYARRNQSEDTTGRLKGRGTHTAVLEPERFLIDYALFKGKRRAGKDWEAFKELHGEDNILKRDEYDHCIRVAKAVRANKAAADILNRAKTEQTIEWTDAETGLRCKARLDIVIDGWIFDLKGVKSTDPRLLASEIARQLYYCQLAWYLDGYEAVTGKANMGGLICAEHNEPHDVAVVELDEGSINLGRETVRGWLRKVAECDRARRWPGRNEERQLIALPPWAFDDDEDFDEGLTATVIEGGNDVSL